MERMNELARLLEIQHQRNQQALHSIIEREKEIRSELSGLQKHSLIARQHCYEKEPAMRSMGAELIWEKWLEKSREKLNFDLAKTLATKEIHLSRVRKSFGKLQATSATSEQLAQAAKKKIQRRFLDETISHDVLKNQ